ncbi:RHS repeat-associated core domain-containing protein, partial [Tenacibaculum finnmarkense]
YNEEGETTWERSLDSNGKVKTGDNSSCPFLFQGQYYDEEIELAYNRFRYYNPDDGRYISKDPIGLNSGEFNFYSYVDDSNSLVDVLGLDTVYGRKRDHKNKGDFKPYVGSAKNGIKKRYTKGELKGKDGKDHFTTPDHDTTRGLEQIIFERGKEKTGNENYWDNKNNPVSPAHEGGQAYKDGLDKYTYRKTKAKEFMQEKYGNNWESKIDTAFGF